MGVTVPQLVRTTEVSVVDLAQSTTVNSVDREREWLGLVPRAFGRSGLTHKRAAAELEMDPALLSRQLAGAQNAHLSFRKMWKLPPEFWRELIVLLAEFHEITLGGTQQDAEDAAIGRLMREAVKRVTR